MTHPSARFGAANFWYTDGVTDKPGVTMGVEEEFLLVDPVQGVSVPAAAEVLDRTRTARLPRGAAITRELRCSQIEAATGVCTTAAELRAQLAANRAVVAGAAQQAGVAAVPVGTPPLGDGRAPAVPSGDDRYARIDARYAEIARGYEACGLHVHIGVADRDVAVGVVGMLNPWLPTLLALSVNSPFRHGRDTGHGSWRIVEQSRFPGSGLAPTVADHRAWEAEVGRLVDCGALVDEAQTFWFARPSPHLPTVELRVADTAAVLDDAIAQALLARALVRTALTELEAGRTPASLPSALAQAAVWSAARYGCGGPAIDLGTGTRTTGSRLVRALLDHTRDALADSGDLDEIHTLAGETHRAGAQRQRDAAAMFGIAGVVRHLALRPKRDDQRGGGHHVRCG